MKFREAAAEWMKDYAATSGMKGRTIEAHESDMILLNNLYGDVIIDKITHTQHQKILNKLFKDGFELNSIARYQSTANLIFK